jgi:cytochrome c-type biogenesis protein CcmH
MAFALMSPATAQDGGVNAPLAYTQLEDPRLEAQASELMEMLRCIQCQGQSIADSDAPIAGAMRSEVRQRIKAGESQDAIRKWMIGRYGEYISFQPEASGAGLLLWLAPLLLLLIGILMARKLFRRGSV